MSTRREFLQVAASWSAAAALPASLAATEGFPSRRPAPGKRKFVSESVEAKIAEVKKSIADPEMGWLFENCFPNTLDTTVQAGTLDGKPDTFVITGDINAMWLRDSSAQVWPYLPLTKGDARLRTLLAGVINRQTRCVLIDPYANAFNFGPTGSEWSKDRTQMKPELHERKWEIDSLCYTVRLAHGYWKTTGDASCFDQKWQDAAALIVKTFREQQRFHGPGPYSFQRLTEVPTDTLPLSGYGNPTRPCGLIHSGFRPSDDACIYPYLVPSNFFAVTSRSSKRNSRTSSLRKTAAHSPRRSTRRSSSRRPRIIRSTARSTPTKWMATEIACSWTIQTSRACSRCPTWTPVRTPSRSIAIRALWC
jgi:meiotically up-regulated gene 157 (Mug157) protein